MPPVSIPRPVTVILPYLGMIFAGSTEKKNIPTEASIPKIRASFFIASADGFPCVDRRKTPVTASIIETISVSMGKRRLLMQTNTMMRIGAVY